MTAATTIHPTAIIHERAVIGADVSIGPYCIIDSGVTIGNRVQLLSHVVIAGNTTIGDDTTIYPFASLGHPPQDLKYNNEPSRLEIGQHNVIREHVTMNPGTEGGGMVTAVGDHCLFMVGTHVAHDCQLGDRVIMANNATLAGHVTIGNHAVIGGLAAVHQFVRIGRHAMIGGMSGVEQDVIPFGSVAGDRAYLAGLNLVGLKRHGFSREAIHQMRDIYRGLFERSEGTLQSRAEALKSSDIHPEVSELVDFVLEESKRSFCGPE